MIEEGSNLLMSEHDASPSGEQNDGREAELPENTSASDSAGGAQVPGDENVNSGTENVAPSKADDSKIKSADKDSVAAKDRHYRAPQGKDNSIWIVFGTIAFIGFVIVFFVYSNIKSKIPPRKTIIVYKKNFEPMEDLVRCKVTTLAEDKWELDYNFAALVDQRDKLTVLLRDWLGPMRSKEEQLRLRLKKHKPIMVPKGSPPMTPLLSKVSFQYDLDIEIEVEPTRKCFLLVFFNFFYKYETTGTALKVDPSGSVQFVRYRKNISCDYPRGQKGQLEWESGKKVTIVIRVKDKPFHAGYTCTAISGDKVLTSAEFLPQWPKDRRYDLGESKRFIQADSIIPPQSGFVGAISSPNYAVKIHRIILRGTVAEYWREQRSKTIRVLAEPIPGAIKNEAESDGVRSTPDEKEASDAEPESVDGMKLKEATAEPVPVDP